MFSRIVPLAVRSAAVRAPSAVSSRGFSATIGEAITAGDAAELSGYSKIDFSINEDSLVIDAVQKFAAFNIGCLVTTNSKGTCS
jgi:predicted transcriptional regulator